MELHVRPTATSTLRRKPGHKPSFDPSRYWIKYYIRHLGPDLRNPLARWAAAHGFCVEQALNIVLRTGLKALP
jgi:hypothetical protein